MLCHKWGMRFFIVITLWKVFKFWWRWYTNLDYVMRPVTLRRCSYNRRLLLLFNELLILLPRFLHFLLGFIPFKSLSGEQLLSVSLQLGLEALLFVDLLALFFLEPPLLLLDLVLQHPLQVLLLLLLPLILHLGDLSKPVHRTRDRRPWILKWLLKCLLLIVIVLPRLLTLH